MENYEELRTMAGWLHNTNKCTCTSANLEDWSLTCTWHTPQTTDIDRCNIHYLWGMQGRRDGAPQARCGQPPYQEHLYTLPWCHSSAPAFGHSAAPHPPSSALPPPYHVSCGQKRKGEGVINCKWEIKLFLWQHHGYKTGIDHSVSSPLLKRVQIRSHRAHWPSSQTQAHGSSVIGVKTNSNYYRDLLF